MGQQNWRLMTDELVFMRNTKKYDVIVCGCGVAGFCAAIAAARNGAKVAVVERYTMPGGILTVLGNNSIDQFNNPFRKNNKMIIQGIGWEFVNRIAKDGFAHIPDMNAKRENHEQYGIKVNPIAAAKIMDDMLLEENVDLLYGQPLVSVKTKKQLIESICIATKNGLEELYASIFIDCTGDGDFAHLAGAKSIAGDGNGTFQPGTLRIYPALHEKTEDKILNFGDNTNHVVLDTTNNTSIVNAEINARRMLYEQMLNGKRMMACAPAIAPREGRRIQGITTMLVEDYFSGKQYEDSVCYTFWFVDIHRKGQSAKICYIEHEKTPSVRYSSMISCDFQNLMMAGRCISTDRETNSAIRVKASCMAMGEAVGTAAALSCKNCVKPYELDIWKLKKQLHMQGAIVPGISDGVAF